MVLKHCRNIPTRCRHNTPRATTPLLLLALLQSQTPYPSSPSHLVKFAIPPGYIAHRDFISMSLFSSHQGLNHQLPLPPSPMAFERRRAHRRRGYKRAHKVNVNLVFSLHSVHHHQSGALRRLRMRSSPAEREPRLWCMTILTFDQVTVSTCLRSCD